VNTVTTLDRIDPIGRNWLPGVAAAPPIAIPEDEEYVGKHRSKGGRTLSLHRMLYTPRHRAT
jgi:hypothetical protein